MFAENWKRPASVPFPSVWRRFSRRDPKNGDVIRHFRIQDAETNMKDLIFKHMLDYFIKDEPTCKAKKLSEDEASVEDALRLWQEMLAFKCSLVCLEEDAVGNLLKPEEKDALPEIVGLNLLAISDNKKSDKKVELKGKVFSSMFNAMDWVQSKVDVFGYYGVDMYMAAFGLSVQPKYRGMGIGLELLLARKDIGQAIGIRVTSTIFAALSSQIIAARAGFETLIEKSYEEIEQETGCNYPGITTKSLKIMARRLDQD